MAGVGLAFEAAVAGGIPVVKGIREGLAADQLNAVFGILNGTCNFILSEMTGSGSEFNEVLAEAQRRGYAETNPAFDIDGIDAAHKLAILAGLAFNGIIDFSSIYIEGIRHVSALDIAYAAELGYRIKLLGLARRNTVGIELRVHPCMVPAESPIAAVNGVFNAVVAQGEPIGQVMMVGHGAGGGPTASAVIADLLDIARGCQVPPLGIPGRLLPVLSTMPMEHRFGAYYLRLMVVDRPGVIADITAHMRDEAISVESILQRGRSPDDAVPVVITTHETYEENMLQALTAISRLDSVLETPRLIRIETLLA
jgi:homoserine dehydrogenase